MTIQSLYTAATGMQAMETKLDVIANNLANVNTLSFKKDRASFEDLFYRHEAYPGVLDAAGNPTPTGKSIGLGTRVSSVQTEFTQGSFQQTGKQLDIAIEGDGFLKVNDPSGLDLYTRAGNLNINANGELVVGSAHTGRVLSPSIQIDETVEDITITPTGDVMVKLAGNESLQNAGNINLARFIDPDGLEKRGENLYAITDASGQPQEGTPGQNGLGIIRQGVLESSNVNPVTELIDMITTQRSFELNSQAIRAGDEMLQLVTNLRR